MKKLTDRINIWEEKHLTQEEKENIARIHGDNPEWLQVPTYLRKEIENRIIDEKENQEWIADDEADKMWAELAEKEKNYWYEITRGVN